MPTGPLAGLRHVTLENRWVRRSWCIDEGLATTEYVIRPRGEGPWLEAMHWHPWWPVDGIVSVNGVDLPISRTVDPPELGMIRGRFNVVDTQRINTGRGDQVDFILTPDDDAPGVTVTLHCELLRDHAMLRTWMTIANTGESAVDITSLAMESVYTARIEMEIMMTGFDTECFEGNDPRFPGRGIPRTTRLHQSLAPGEVMDGFWLLSAICPADSRWHIATRHDMLHAFAPHTKHPRILQQADQWKDIDELQLSIDEAAEVGVDAVLLFVGEGCSYGRMEINPRLFPRGEADLKSLCEYAAARGVEIGFYVGECIVPFGDNLLEEHEDWQFLGPDGTRYDPGGIGNMCPSSPWGEHFRKRIDRFIELGVTVFQTDGPPYRQACFADSHGHRNGNTACIDNWRWEQRFNRDMAERGVYVQTPSEPSRLFDGAGQICGGYTEDDQSVLTGLDQITQFRANLVAANDQLPPSCRWGFLSVGEMYGGARPSMVGDPENELIRLEHALATHLGGGFTACLHGKHLFNGPDSKAAVKRWTDFTTRYHHLLTCRTLTLRPPDGRGIDGVFHCNPAAGKSGAPCAVAVLLNPTDAERTAALLLPLEFCGWRADRSAAAIERGENTPRPLTVDDQGQALLTVSMAAEQVTWWEIRLE